MRERRRLERYALHIPATIEIDDVSGTKEVLHLETRDISANGAFLESSKHISEGAHIKLDMVLSVEKLQELIGAQKEIELMVDGTVVRSDSVGIAVVFNRKYQIKALNHKHRK